MKLAYISAISNSRVTNLKIDLDNKSSANKLRSLKAGHTTTFDILEDDGFKSPADTHVTEKTVTIYAQNLQVLHVAVVEPDTLET